MSTFTQHLEQPREQEPTFLEMQDQFYQDWFDARFGVELSFKDYVDLWMRCSRSYGNYNDDIRQNIGKIKLSCFDGSRYTISLAWVQKDNMYF
jgi:hypothetical protein